ncbi:MAG: purine-binding chemotaxis protein CheW [Deltaproteobacteria bacterium]|nr:purine-binding chemotaxis protein CheW [Deltaproteobacteria bacterium]NCP03814.1 purine-binding chemotaxis protein CheW [Deltaproteobacteria bacterium]
MNLADIRKKVRAATPVCAPPARGSSCDQPLALSLSDAAGELGALVGLEELDHFATEQDYLQGLESDQHQDVDMVQWVGFFLGEEEYALDIQVVSELIKPRSLTELPRVPAHVLGIMTLRGEVVPVLDLKQRLGITAKAPSGSDAQRIVVCETPGQRVGLLVDRVSQVLKLPRDAIEKPTLAGDEPLTAFILGIGRKDGQMLILLRPEKALEIL